MTSSTSPCHPLQAHPITTSPPHHYKSISLLQALVILFLYKFLWFAASSCHPLQAYLITTSPCYPLQTQLVTASPCHPLQAHLIITSPGHHHKPISSLQAQVILYIPMSLTLNNPTSSSTNPSHPRPLQADLVFCKPTSSSSSTSPDHKLMSFSFPTSPCHPLLQQSCLTPYAHIIISLCKPISCFNFRCWPISSAHVSLLLLSLIHISEPTRRA